MGDKLKLINRYQLNELRELMLLRLGSGSRCVFVILKSCEGLSTGFLEKVVKIVAKVF